MNLNRQKGQVLPMASYTKTLDLEVTAGYNAIITSDVLRLQIEYTGNSAFASGTFQFPINADLLYKTVTRWNLYVYCKKGSGNKVQYRYSIRGATLGSATLQTGWNNIEYVPSFNDILRREDYGKIDIEAWNTDNGSFDIELYTEDSSYKPYIVITYEDTPPAKPTSLYPNNTVVNARNEIRFSWAHNSQEKTPQKGFVLEYSTDGGSNWTTISQTTANQYYDMPANTLPLTGEILWRVKTVDANGLESPYSNGKINTAVVPQKAPALVSPLSGYLDGFKSITFKWNFIGGTAEDKQSKYDLQYSLNQGSSWTTVTNSSNVEEHTFPENTFQSGNIYWRVRTYNNYGDVSPYSEIGSFYVINSPPIPQITDVTNAARPEITWISTEQQIYELQILKNDEVIFETGNIPSMSDKSYKLKDYLNDGEYLARLRVTNEYNLTSPWAEYMFTISTTKPQKPTIRLFSSEYSIVIRTEETSLKTLVYRDDKLIGEIKEGYFEDYTGENRKEYKYFIRVVDENDNFNDSNVRIGRCRFRDNTLALASKPNDFIKLRYGFNSEPKKTTKVGNVGSLIYFDGRKYPATEFTEFKEYAKTLSFFIRSKRELDELIRLIDRKETLLYRDSEGENIYGTTFSIDYEKTTFGYDVNFTIMKTSDYYD